MDLPVVSFDSYQIAPCGINCGTCYAFLRAKNKCPGCRTFSSEKPKTRRDCIIKTCAHYADPDAQFCHDCEKLPCKRLKELDKRYQLKYHTSLIQNLLTIKEAGMIKFLEAEVIRWSCPECGSTLSIHCAQCLKCGHPK